MPKNIIKKEPFSEKELLLVLNAQGKTKKELTHEDISKGILRPVQCDEKTIRRACAEGKIKKEYLLQISEYLDVDPDLLTGKIRNNASITAQRQSNDKQRQEIIINKLCDPKAHPFFVYQQKIQSMQSYIKNNLPITAVLKDYLAAFEISPYLYDTLPINEQCDFQEELFEATYNIATKYFSKIISLDSLYLSYSKLLYDLDEYRERLSEEEYAQKVLLPKYLSSPPLQYTKKEIRTMNSSQLLAIEQEVKTLEWAETTLRNVYIKSPPKGFSEKDIRKMSSQKLLEIYLAEDPFEEKYEAFLKDQ